MENKEQAQQAVYKETIDSLMQRNAELNRWIEHHASEGKIRKRWLEPAKRKAEEANLEIVLRNFQRCNGYRIADCRTDSDGHG